MKYIQGPVGWGIIGCGDVCEVKSGPAFNNVSNSKLVAVMRRDKALAEDFARRHGVPKSYSDAAALIHDAEVNAIYVATPPVFHEEYLLEAMKAGKPVYVEKPVTLNAASCERMMEYSHSYSIRASVAHYRRGLPLFRKVKSLVQDGAIGTVRLVKLSTQLPEANRTIPSTQERWRVKPELSGGGLFHDLSPHQLDILYWIFGPPRVVSGRSVNQARLYNAPDLTALEAIYKNEVVLQGIWIFNVAESAAQDSCEIIGDKGKLQFSFFKKSTLEITTDVGTESLEFDYPVNIQHPMIEMVVRYFRGEGPNPCSLEDALVVMKMMDTTTKAHS